MWKGYRIVVDKESEIFKIDKNKKFEDYKEIASNNILEKQIKANLENYINKME